MLPGVKYVKIKTEGRGRLPSLNGVLRYIFSNKIAIISLLFNVFRFFNAVDNVIAKNPGKIK